MERTEEEEDREMEADTRIPQGSWSCSKVDEHDLLVLLHAGPARSAHWLTARLGDKKLAGLG